MDIDTTQALGVVGLVVVSFLAGRFSNHISCCRRNSIVNSVKKRKRISRNDVDVSEKGIYSKKFYKNQLEHTKLVSFLN